MPCSFSNSVHLTILDAGDYHAHFTDETKAQNG